MEGILLLLLKYKYLILFPLAAFEGPIVGIIVGFLIFSGVLSFWPAFFTLLLGDIVPDTTFYSIGYFGQKSKFVEKYFLKSKFFINHIDIVKKLWHEHPLKTMFFGKLAAGMALPFLVSAGIVKVPYRKFITYTTPISIFQYSTLTAVGFYLGNSYAASFKYFDYAYVVLSFGILVFAIIYIIAVKYARKKMIDLEKTEQNKSLNEIK